MTSVLALPAHHPATPLVSPLSSNFSRQLRFIGFRRRQLLRTNVAMPIAVCAEKKKEVNPFLKFAVGAVTEILRIFNRKDSSEIVSAATPSDVSVADVDDLIAVLESDYNRSYFLTGEFTTSIYAEDCCFVDPTIKFNGRDLYQRNLQLLVPFFENPSLLLSSIEQDTTYVTDPMTWEQLLFLGEQYFLLSSQC
ncbi:uncharacterized protein LOC131037897 isoform X3 [Cryptomeria japonica]|uniref:uncharacterized protein LOC131037897 isoform X3 n=1 Tax=Cryptomeria japonica TaxID=3369 RepID=UPI0025AD2931|nr:uncharacterized protein LOC131037897 isoform X3 [Cryptomeria japonica]